MSQHENNTVEQQKEAPDENKLIAKRREKLAELRKQGQAYPNDFRRKHLAQDLFEKYDGFSREQLAKKEAAVEIAGRMMFQRVMGKASFAHLQDMSGKIQIFVQQNGVGEESYNAFKNYDIGDIVAAKGIMFKTQTGELSLKLNAVRLLSKALRPLPEKFHGLTNQEQKYRQRYIDLIMHESSRNTFQIRAKTIQFMRNFLVDKGFQEVETPMMQVIPGGATAKPFVTHHNALDMDLFLRIAPELYLKRLVVGGMEQVFEINKNFRNEGLSTRHNPEFTMIEFYQAYADYTMLMDLTEEMLRGLTQNVLGTTQITYQGDEYDFETAFTRMTVVEAILHYHPNIKAATLDELASCSQLAEKLSIQVDKKWGLGKLQIEIFEAIVEEKLMQPTFITAYPTEVSPLARNNDDNPSVTDRFEFFLGGRELANGFSELNDPEEQAERFMKQVAEKQAGDAEAMHFDADYIRALEYAMPPTAGEGIGIDRLVMFLTDSASIKDVLLFPQMRPE